MVLSYSFACVCWSLASIYIVLGVLSLFQLGRMYFRQDNCTLLAGTVQQQVHWIVFLLCVVRSIFFFVTVDAWNPIIGEVVSEKVLFYSLDEYATILYFTLTSALALFWAELYYISTEQAGFFSTVVRPATYLVNIAALIGVSICSYYVSITFTSDVYYVFMQYTIIIATVYFMSAVMFTYYACAAASELKQAPIQLTARRNRLRLLRLLGAICISALIIRACLVIYYTGRQIETTSAGSLTGLFFYYFSLEIFPIFTVLIFYRVESLEPGDEEEDQDDYLRDPLEISPLLSNRLVTPSSRQKHRTRTFDSSNSRVQATSAAQLNSSSSAPQQQQQQLANDDIVDAIIARLSTSHSHSPSPSSGGSSQVFHSSLGSQSQVHTRPAPALGGSSNRSPMNKNNRNKNIPTRSSNTPITFDV